MEFHEIRPTGPEKWAVMAEKRYFQFSPLIFNDLQLNRLFVILQTHTVHDGLLSLVKFPFTQMTPSYHRGEQFSWGQWAPGKWVISLQLAYSI